MAKGTSKLNKQRQAFLLSFFPEDSGKAHKEVNGFILEKHMNGNTDTWQVAIYTPESWTRRTLGQQKFFENHNRMEYLIENE